MRRTKQEAMETRATILDAAERIFEAQGVARTALSDIAREADVTRGAIYWHFANKAALFRAMHERVQLPQEEFFESRALASAEHCLDALFQTSMEAIGNFACDERAQRVYRIMLFRCEYVGEMQESLCERRQADDHMKRTILEVFDAAAAKGELHAAWTPKAAANSYYCAMVGLFNEWLKSDGGFDFESTASAMLATLFESFGDGPGRRASALCGGQICKSV